MRRTTRRTAGGKAGGYAAVVDAVEEQRAGTQLVQHRAQREHVVALCRLEALRRRRRLHVARGREREARRAVDARAAKVGQH